MEQIKVFFFLFLEMCARHSRYITFNKFEKHYSIVNKTEASLLQNKETNNSVKHCYLYFISYMIFLFLQFFPLVQTFFSRRDRKSQPEHVSMTYIQVYTDCLLLFIFFINYYYCYYFLSFGRVHEAVC